MMAGGPRVTLNYPYNITIDGKPHRITIGEAQILFSLMATRVCSKDLLADAIWPGFTRRPLCPSNAISNYIWRLRQILEGHWRIINRFNQGWTLEKETPDA